jgi:hypothetical protein
MVCFLIVYRKKTIIIQSLGEAIFLEATRVFFLHFKAFFVCLPYLKNQIAVLKINCNCPQNMTLFFFYLPLLVSL